MQFPGVFIISIKNDLVLSHIETLESGAKISVRGLSSELGVSEGTVYKAIKEAEARGLVITKPQSGTFRIESNVSPDDKEIELSDISALLAASVAAGKHFLNRGISKLILCDGDETQLDAQLSGFEAPEVLCLVGNRPDMQAAVVNRGANLLLTGGAKAADSLIIKADSAGICILSTNQSAFTVLHLFDAQFSSRKPLDSEPPVSDWMETPDYLYRNDIAADWQRFYHDNLHWLNYYPIVDDDLRICGGVDINQAFSAPDSQRLSALIAEDAHILTVNADCPVRELARKMLMTGSTYAAVVRGGRMEGIIYDSDIIRCFMLSREEGGGKKYAAALGFLPDCSTEDRLVYELSVPAAARGDMTAVFFAPAFLAAEKHLAQKGLIEHKLESSSFYFPESFDGAEALMLSTSLTSSMDGGCLVELEIYSEAHSCAKGMLVYSAHKG